MSDEQTNTIQGIQNLLKKTMDELSVRENKVSEREAKVAKILEVHGESLDHVVLQVGSVVYHTTAHTLLANPDSFFHGLLSPKFREDKEKPIFIDRDGEIFKYILEYLMYGQLISVIDDAGVLQKLSIDADYYMLPPLAKQLKSTRVEHSKEKKDKILLRLQSTATASNGSWFNWNQQITVPPSHFAHNGSNTTTILTAGIYQIVVRYVVTCSTHGNGSANIDLYVSGTVVARLYHGDANGYQKSNTLTEILPLKVNDTIMIKYISNSNGVADQLGNTLTIMLID